MIEGKANVRVVLIDKDGDYARMRKESPSYRTIDELENTVSYILTLLDGLSERIFKAESSASGYVRSPADTGANIFQYVYK